MARRSMAADELSAVRLRRSVAAALATTLTFAAPAASALELGPPLKTEGSWQVDGEVGLAGDSDAHSSTLDLSPAVRVSYRLVEPWKLSAQLGTAWLSTSPDSGNGQSRWVLSNLVLGGGLARGTLEDGWFAARAVIAAPTGRIPSTGPERGLARSAYAFALAARGLYEPWMWAPDQAGFAVEGAVGGATRESGKARTRILAGAEGGLGVTVPVDDPTAEPQVFGELAAEAMVSPRPFAIGPRLQAVWMPLATTAHFQTSVGGVLVVRVGESGRGRLQVLKHIDAPLGGGLGGWGFMLSGSGSW